MDSGDCETEEDSAPEASCVSPESNEGALLPSNSREMRNRAEKMRRDKLNSYIGELASLVPMVAKSAKRMDKTSILRLTATHLRIYQTLLSNGSDRPSMELPPQMDQYILEQLVCEQLGGFLLILTPTGKIVFVSHTVENLLGHLQTDLMGQSIFNITSGEDHDRLRMYIHEDSALDNEWKKCFNVRLKRTGPRTETPVFEPVRIVGVHRPCRAPTSTSSSTSCTEISTTSSTCSSSGSSTSASHDVLLFFVRIYRPEPISERLLEATKDEYVTRHLIDGRIINCDQRISLIAGYMTEEVSGLSAFKFMHRDDVRWVMIALRQMYDRGESKGSSCYRLQSRNGEFIFLRTFGYLEIDDQGTVESFVCINSLVSEAEGIQLIDEMKKRFSALINSQMSPVTSGSGEASLQSVEDPNEVEAAIVHLITNLPSPGGSSCDNRSTPSPQIMQMSPSPAALAPILSSTLNNTRTTTNGNENQDCCPFSPPQTDTPSPPPLPLAPPPPPLAANHHSSTVYGRRQTVYHTLKIKTAAKRPPESSDGDGYKRQKVSSSSSSSPQPQPPVYLHKNHNESKAQITEITQPPDQQLYKQHVINKV